MLTLSRSWENKTPELAEHALPVEALDHLLPFLRGHRPRRLSEDAAERLHQVLIRQLRYQHGMVGEPMAVGRGVEADRSSTAGQAFDHWQLKPFTAPQAGRIAHSVVLHDQLGVTDPLEHL